MRRMQFDQYDETHRNMSFAIHELTELKKENYEQLVREHVEPEFQRAILEFPTRFLKNDDGFQHADSVAAGFSAMLVHHFNSAFLQQYVPSEYLRRLTHEVQFAHNFLPYSVDLTLAAA